MDEKVEKLRQQRKKGAVGWMEFLKLYTKYKQSYFCFVEGDDDGKYYEIRVCAILGNTEINVINSGGKEGVTRFKRILSESSDFELIKSMFFVDRDFDPPLNDPLIYETPCYSIENLYTTQSAFGRILTNEFGISRGEEDYERCINQFRVLQESFHNAVILLNSWMACQREISANAQLGNKKHPKLNINKINLRNFIDINIDSVIVKYNLETLLQKFPEVDNIPESMLESKISMFTKVDKQRVFRGKFEIEFLRSFLEVLKREKGYFLEERNTKIVLTKENILSDLSQYADFPDCLRTYISARNREFAVSS
ncbi:DUF4435 domain-containing protein [Tumebacillus avium]|nr:DUF4435 domain-containing protein [Tumebacillus avium]